MHAFLGIYIKTFRLNKILPYCNDGVTNDEMMKKQIQYPILLFKKIKLNTVQ